MKKYEWRKEEKSLYLPKAHPGIVDIPTFIFLSLEGVGNPNSEGFDKRVEALYALSYTIKMAHKKGFQPKDFYQYTVYPLEGVWDIREEYKAAFDGKIDKDQLVYNIMIRQPNFVSRVFFQEALEVAKKKKKNEFLEKVRYIKIKEGISLQMLHLGSYDSETETFSLMEEFCKEQSLERVSKKHREIYLSDPRKVETARLKTVLRFKVKKG